MAESEMVRRVAAAMKKRASEPVVNLPHVDNVLVGSLGDVWAYLAAAAIEAMRNPPEYVLDAMNPSGRYAGIVVPEAWNDAINAALWGPAVEIDMTDAVPSPAGEGR